MWRDYDIPKKYKILGNFIKSENTDYEYRFWTDHECVELLEKKYFFLLDIVKNCKNRGERSDIFRYCILHSQGGVYLDLDYKCFEKLNSIKELSNVDLFLCYDDELSFEPVGLKNVIANCFMAATPNSLFFEKVIKSLKTEMLHKIFLSNKALFTDEVDITLSKTGPLLITNVFNTYKNLLKNYYIGTNFKFINRSKIFPDQFGAHLCYHSWFTPKVEESRY